MDMVRLSIGASTIQGGLGRGCLEMDHNSPITPAERNQFDFDARMQGVREEGWNAHRAGLSREDCPYVTPAMAQERTTWIGGWAEAALGLDDAAPAPSPGPR
jgi:ribosome modulation factor